MSNNASMEITTVIGCKVACKFCPQKLLASRYGNATHSMSLGDFSRCLDKIPPEVPLHFSGMAEPFLNPDCADMILRAFRKGHAVSLYTTLVGATQADYEKLQEAGVVFQNLCYHIPDAEFNAVIPITEEYKTLLYDMVRNWGLGKNTTFSCHGPIHSEVYEIVKSLYPLDNEMIDRAGAVETVDRHQHIDGKITCARCLRAFDRNILLPDGRVLLCCNDYGLQHVLGNLLEQDYASLHSGPEFQRVLAGCEDDSLPLICRECHAAKLYDPAEETQSKEVENHQNPEIISLKNWYGWQMEELRQQLVCKNKEIERLSEKKIGLFGRRRESKNK